MRERQDISSFSAQKKKILARAKCAVLVEVLEERRMLSAGASGMVAHPLDIPAAGSSSVPVGSPTMVGLTPAQIDGAYGINGIQFGSVAGNGAGQTIAIIVAYDNPDLVDSSSPDFLSSDLHQFDLAMGIADPPSFVKVDQAGGTNYPPTDPSGDWENESAMDVEWAHAAAPAANIILVECNSGDLSDLIGAGVVYAAAQPGVSVVSMSFAADEAPQETGFDADLTTPAGHQGVTFIAGTGDFGVPGEYPAFSPNVVAVGSTTLYLDNNGDYAGESGYSDSGGGISAYEPKPAYQDLVSTGSSSNRTIPDVSFDGDDTTGGAVYDAYNGGSSNPWYEVGGTSFGAPNWAGIIAIADQGRALEGLGSLDGPSQTLPRLYGLPSSDFHDITTGESSGGSGNGGYNAAVGYDLVTGLGTPVANLLGPDLAGGTGSIAGSIFADASGDGVRTVNDKPLVGWTVNLTEGGSLVGTTSTAANGAFSFSGLTPGTYVASIVVPTGYQQTLPSAGAYTVSIGNGQTMTAVTFAAEPVASPTSTRTTMGNNSATSGKTSAVAGTAAAGTDAVATVAGGVDQQSGDEMTTLPMRPAKRGTTSRNVASSDVVTAGSPAVASAAVVIGAGESSLDAGRTSWLDWFDGLAFVYVAGI